MSDPRSAHPPASTVDADGVRVIRRPPARRLPRREALAAALLLGGIALLPLLRPAAPVLPAAGGVPAATPPASPARPVAASGRTALPMARAAAAAPAPAKRPAAPAELPPEVDHLPSLDPDDIAAYLRPGDPEPTMAELIDALRHAGIHDGLAAFNPPGTSPPLEGIAVPDDAALPEGYVRHHQVTDQGEPIAPILMFAPDVTAVHIDGQPVPVPADRVVPEAMVPPGLPIRRVRIPSP